MILGIPFIDNHRGLEVLEHNIWMSGLWIPRYQPYPVVPLGGTMDCVRSHCPIDVPRIGVVTSDVPPPIAQC